MRVLDISYRFHWKFWNPKQCVDGEVGFGLWVKVTIRDEDGEIKVTDHTWDQFRIKADMGLFRTER